MNTVPNISAQGLRSILLHVDAAPRCAERLRVAQALAARHGAALDLLYAVTPAVLSQPLGLAEAAAATMQVLQEVDDERRHAAERMVREAGAGAAWAVAGEASPLSGLVEQALFADLLVMGQHDAAQPWLAGTPVDFVESVLLSGGRPALVLPFVGRFETVGERVLLAWKPTREAAQALAAALPLLRGARTLHVVGASDDERPRLATFLARHGVAATPRHHAPLEGNAGELLLSLASEFDADLLVMGCYGHSRAREWVLGGATRTMLRSMTLPVLMAH
jgi:nucleotide-binding universal stress UspA family protein